MCHFVVLGTNEIGINMLTGISYILTRCNDCRFNDHNCCK